MPQRFLDLLTIRSKSVVHAVTNAREGITFAMSQLLLKLDAKDNIPFSREMHRIEKEENALDLLD